MPDETLSRLFARRSVVLLVVMGLLLMAMVGGGAWASGYGDDTGGLRSSFSQIVFPMLIVAVITLTAPGNRQLSSCPLDPDP